LGNIQANTPHVKVRALVSSLVMAAVSIGAVTARLQQTVAPSQVTEPPPPFLLSEINIYQHAETLIDWSPSQIHGSPFLRDVRLTESQDQLPTVLEHVGQTVTLLFHDFPQVACDEEVNFETESASQGATMLQKFRYIVIPQPLGGAPAFEEYRTDLKGNPFDASGFHSLFIITYDFASTCLYLSPADQRDSRFRYFGIQKIRKRECHVVGFAQEPERAHRGGKFRAQGKSVVMLLQGLAWIDSESFQVLRIKTWLLAPRTDVGLSSLTSTVDFSPVRPTGSDKALWLPRDVTVEAIDQGIRARNTHHYSNFKLFRVESTIKPTG
jgi:uncharacterized protein (DUF433 family)